MEESDLSAELAELRHRVEALESAAPRAAAPDAEPVGEAEVFWALEGLRARLDETTRDGAVMMVGTLRLPTGEPVDWQEGIAAHGLLETDWSQAAATLAALAHPVRIELLRNVLSGVRSTADLAAIETLESTGQLHHHLRQLLAAGWLRQVGRGRYEVPAKRVVPLLVTMMGAEV